MFIKRDVRSRHAYRTSSLFLCFILSSWKRTNMVPEIIIQVEFFLCFHAPSFYFDREIKGEYLALRYFKTTKLERTAENRKTWAFLCMGFLFFVFFFVFFYKTWSYCLYSAHCDDNPNINVPYFTKEHSGCIRVPILFRGNQFHQTYALFPAKASRSSWR